MAEALFRDARFDSLRNALYHTARRNFFDRANKFLNFLVIVLGAGVVGKVATLRNIPEVWFELSIVVAATIQLVFDLGSRSRDHEILQRRYYELISKIEKVREPTDEDRQGWSAEMALIAADETMTMRALDAIAYNNALDATYSDEDFKNSNRLHVWPWQALCRNFLPFNSTQFKVKRRYRKKSGTGNESSPASS